MPNEILPNTGVELPDVGSDQDTWGDILNNDLRILDVAIQYDVISKTLSNVDVTLTAAEAASAVINLTGTLTANVNVIVPATPVRVYLVRNQTSGAFTVTVKTAAGTGTPIQQGTSSLVYSDGTNIIQGATSVNGSFAVSGALTAGSINSTPVGNATPSSGAFTTLSASGATTLNGAVTLGDASGDAIAVTGTATFAQAAQFPDGTAALPAITNTGDTNTGRFFPAEDVIAESTGGVERARITSAGYFKASNTGSYGSVAGLGDLSTSVDHVIQSDQDTKTLRVVSSSTGANVNNVSSALATGSAGFHFEGLLNNVLQYRVLANGNVQNSNNSYGALSDIKVKNLIGPAPSYWERYKLIEWVKYTLKNDPTNQEQLGVIAQQVRDIFPGLIEETPDMHEVTKTREVTKTVPVTTTETQTTERTEIVLVNGEYIQKTIAESVDVQVPVVDEFDLKNEAGEVIGTHKVPRMQTITETETYTEMEPTGTVTLSVKYSILGHISDVVLQEAMSRIEALEAR